MYRSVMKLGIVLYSNDPETVFQAFRLGTLGLKKGDDVRMFMLAKGVECDTLDNEKWHISDQIRDFQDHGGKTFSCTSCLKIRDKKESLTCPMSSLADLYQLISECDKLLTF